MSKASHARIALAASLAFLCASAVQAQKVVKEKPAEREARERNTEISEPKPREPDPLRSERPAERKAREQFVREAHKRGEAMLKDARSKEAAATKSELSNRKFFEAAETARTAAKNEYEVNRTQANFDKAVQANHAADQALDRWNNARTLLESQRDRVSQLEGFQAQALEALGVAREPFPRNNGIPRFMDARPQNFNNLQMPAAVSPNYPRELLSQPQSSGQYANRPEPGVAQQPGHYANAVPTPPTRDVYAALFSGSGSLARMNAEVDAARNAPYVELRVLQDGHYVPLPEGQAPAGGRGELQYAGLPPERRIQYARLAPEQNGARAPVLNVDMASTAARQRQAGQAQQQVNQGEVRAQATRVPRGQ